MQQNLSFEFSLWDSGRFNSSWLHRIYVLISFPSTNWCFQKTYCSLGCFTFHVIFVDGTIITVGLISYSERRALQYKLLYLLLFVGFPMVPSPWVMMILFWNCEFLKLRWLFLLNWNMEILMIISVGLVFSIFTSRINLGVHSLSSGASMWGDNIPYSLLGFTFCYDDVYLITVSNFPERKLPDNASHPLRYGISRVFLVYSQNCATSRQWVPDVLHYPHTRNPVLLLRESSFPLTSEAQGNRNVLSLSMDLFILTLWYKWNNARCDHLCLASSHCIMLSRAIDVAAWMGSSCLLIGWTVFHCINPAQFVCSSVEEHLGWFHF